MRKNACAAFWACLSFFLAERAYAGGYEPLVQIPGVPEGEVDISKYLVGIYNFLLSIVGIVAVVMLIIGGMKYITAAGSGSAVQNAKDTIKDAIFGLLLALMSYVIVSTINPDVLYLRQPGAALTKENITITTANNGATFVHNADGTITYTSPEGYSVILRDEPSQTAQEQADMIASGDLTVLVPVSMQVDYMNTQRSCIAPGSPKGSEDPSYKGKCVCVVGRREITLAAGSTSCSDECMRRNLCGYKFLSIKLNARHGYTQEDGSLGSSGEGSSQTEAGSDEGNLIPASYDLTSDTAVHADEIWEMTQTNDPNWGDFQITFENQNEQFATTATHIFPCAILVTNEQEFHSDQHFVYWVGLGTTVGEKDTLYQDMNWDYLGNCTDGGGGLYGISAGECNQAWTDRIILAKYSDDIVDKCKFCNLADDGSIGKAYRFVRTLTCRGGYWQ